MSDDAGYFLAERYRGLDRLADAPPGIADRIGEEIARIRESGDHPRPSWREFSQELLFWGDHALRDDYLGGKVRFPFYRAVGEEKFWRYLREQAPYLERLAEQYPHVGVPLLEQLWLERGRGMPWALPTPFDQRTRWRSTAAMAPGPLDLAIDAGPYAAVIVTPRCGIGGSEKVMREMIAAMQRLTGLPSLMIVADTEVARDALPAGAICLPNLTYRGEPFLKAPTPARVEALRDLILQTGASRVICINSFIGNSLLIDGALQSAGVKTASAMFCVSVGPGGSIGGYVQIADWLIDAGVTLFTDNDHIARMMAAENFYDGVVVLTLPEVVTPTDPPRGGNVLWAGRIDSQKRPDLLLEIARASPDIVYEVWGVPLLSDMAIMDGLMAQPNILFHGAFDGFAAIDKSNVGALLYTSAYDGTPNLLLEAMASGLACVSTGVGGIPDLMAQGRGVVLDTDAPVGAYVDALRGLLGDPAARDQIVDRARAYIRQHRTQAAFDRTVEDLLAAL